MTVRGSTFVFAVVGFLTACIIEWWTTSPTFSGLSFVVIFGGFSAYALFRNGRDLWRAFRHPPESPTEYDSVAMRSSMPRLEARLHRGLAFGSGLIGPVWNFIVFLFWLAVFVQYFRDR